jgi:hypothetical protein
MKGDLWDHPICVSACLYGYVSVYPPNFSFSMRSASHQIKMGEYFFPRFLVLYYFSKDYAQNTINLS